MKEDQSQSAMIERVDKLTETISAWIQRAEEVSLRRYWAIGRAGENVQIPNFPPKTIYVDNSQNANAINIRLDGEIGVYAIPASGTGYVPCEGVHSIGIEGTGICYLLFINRDIRMVSNNQAFSLSGGLGSSSSDPLFASLTGSSSTLPVLLTARSVTELTAFNAVAITSTTAIAANATVSQFNDKTLWFNNTHNEPLTLTIGIKSSITGEGTYSLPTTQTIAAGARVAVTAAEVPQLAHPFQQIYLQLQASTAPTSGSITGFVEGEPI